MNILRLAGELFLLYILYKLVFDFIIPIYNTTKRVKKQFGDIQEKMNKMNGFNNQAPPTNANTTAQPTPGKKEDYIDYEEVK